MVVYPVDDLAHQGDDVVGGAARVGLDEVCMLRRDVGAAVTVAAQSCGIDETARRIAVRVGEDRTGVLSARLVGTAPPDDVAELGLAALGVAGREIERDLGDDLMGCDAGVAVGQPEVPDRDGGVLAPMEIDDAGAPDRRGHVGAVAACVHPHGTTGRPRHPDGPFEARESQTREPPCRCGQTRGAAEAHLGPVRLDRAERLAEMDDEAGDAGVRDQQIRTPSEHDHPRTQNGHHRGQRHQVLR